MGEGQPGKRKVYFGTLLFIFRVELSLEEDLQ